MRTVDLYQGDCLEVMKSLPDDCADLAITSPPYNMNLRISTRADGSVRYHSRQIVKEITTKYKAYDDNLPMDEYLEFNANVVTELLRISPMVFYNVQFLTGNKVALFKLIGQFAEQLKDIIVWDKINAQPAMRDGVLNSQFETILVFDRDKAFARRFDNAQFERGTLSNHWGIKRGKKTHKDHGAIFPEELVEKIIENFSSEGQTVIDPFMGTGTTGYVARQMYRNFIGIEMDADYYQFASERV